MGELDIPSMLDSIYSGENQLQAINERATRIERQTGVRVLRMHLGDPRAPQRRETDRLTADYMQHRHESLSSRGYEDVAGNRRLRRIVANALTRLNRLQDGEIDEENIVAVSGGTAALNIALSILTKPIVLLPEPYYPPWEKIVQRIGGSVAIYALLESDDYLLNSSILDQLLDRLVSGGPTHPIWLLYHYPHNPTGKTLSFTEAAALGNCLNRLCSKYPNLFVLQEDLYLGTTRADTGIYTPLPFLSAETKQRAIWIHSPTKIGHAQDRIAVIAAFNKALAKRARGACSFDSLGASTPALMAFVHTLTHIAASALDALGTPGMDATNYRYTVADYYQRRIQIVCKGLAHIESSLGTRILPRGAPRGGYYLYPSFQFLKDRKTPNVLTRDPGFAKRFRRSEDVAAVFEHAYKLGLRPLTVAPGSLFERDADTMCLRLACVSDDINMMFCAVNTLWGVVETVTGIKLGAVFKEIDTLRLEGPAMDLNDFVIPEASVLGSGRGYFTIRM